MCAEENAHPACSSCVIDHTRLWSCLVCPGTSQSLATYLQAATERYTGTQQEPSMRQHALLASNACDVEVMQDETLAAIRNQLASTPGHDGTQFLSRPRQVTASIKPRHDTVPQLPPVASRISPPGLKQHPTVDETLLPPSAGKQDVIEVISARGYVPTDSFP